MNHYRTHKSGSAIITVVVILSVTLLIAISIQRITYHTRLAAIERERYLFISYLTDGLLRYGVAMVQERKNVIDQLIDQSHGVNSYELFAGVWPHGVWQQLPSQTYNGIVVVSYRAATQEFVLEAQLYDHTNLLRTQTYHIKRF